MADLISMLAAAAGQAGEETDPFFNQTVLLLHGDGTNGAQNNTFLDSSTNNFTITRNPTNGPNAPTQGTFSPFSVGAGEWSNYFDGSTDYLTTPSNSAFYLSTGDWTVEAWVYKQTTGRQIIVSQTQNSASPYNGWLFLVNTGNVLRFEGSNSAGISSPNTFPLNQWVHVAAVRSSGTITLYENGVSVVSGTPSIIDFAGTLTIGQFTSPVSGSEWNGYISNLRIVKGTAIVPSTGGPTTPLTNVTNTSLLTCQSNRFVDNSSSPKTITRNGDVKVTPFSPFAPSAAYDPAVNGGSGYFDGTGDYLSIADNAAFELGSSNFAIEAWVYPLALPGNNAIANVASQYITTGSRSFLFALYNNAGTMQLLFQPVSGSTDTAISQNFAFKIGEWAHIAAVRSGNNITLYGNGVSLGTTAYSSTINNATGSYLVGARFNASSVAELLFNGYIAGHRLIVGSDTAPSGIPTAPPTNITNTSLLLNFTNAGIFDNTGKNNLETVGNAQIDTTTKKFGTGSMEFDGTGDYLLMPNNVDQQLGTGNFTIELWVYLASGDTGSARGLVAKGTSTTGWLVSLDSSEKVVFTYTTSTITSTGAITTNAWNYIAVVREGTGSNQTKIYINGSNDGTGTVSTDFNQTSVMYVGANRTGGDPMKGFIDDLRITKGIARTITTPTAAFPDL
jgi:hypothetical protein